MAFFPSESYPAATKVFSDIYTIVRNSIKQVLGTDGFIGSVAINTPAFQSKLEGGTAVSKGFLVEPSQTNDLLQSENFTATWARTESTAAANVAISPRNDLTADSLIETALSNQHRVRQAKDYLANIPYCLSVYAKLLPTGSKRDLQISVGSAGNNAQFDLMSGTVINISNSSVNAGIENLGNGWYRCWASTTYLSSVTAGPTDFLIRKPGELASYLGDGISGLLLWGAQRDVGLTPSSYIQTTTASVTRAADQTTIQGAAFAALSVAGPATVLAEVSPQDSRSACLFAVSSETLVDSLAVYLNANGTVTATVKKLGFPDVSVTSSLSLTTDMKNRIALTYQSNSFALWVKGVKLGVALPNSLPTVNRLHVGWDGTSNQFLGMFSQFATDNVVIADSDLALMTA